MRRKLFSHYILGTVIGQLLLLSILSAHAAGTNNITPASHAMSKPVEFFTPQGVPEDRFWGLEIPASPASDTSLVRFYTNNPTSETLPAVIIVPGSGCDGALPFDGEHASGSVETMLAHEPHTYRIIKLEPPGVPRQYNSPDPGTTDGCPAAFMALQSLPQYHAYYREVLEEIRAMGWLSEKRNLLVGGSDGALIAPGAIQNMPEITHVLLISNGGANQIYEQTENTLRDLSTRALNRSSSPKRASDTIETQRTGQELIDEWNRILHSSAKHTSMYAGHPYSRWRTTGLYASVDDIATLNKSLYLVQGGQDRQSTPGSFALLLSTLVARRVPFVAEYVPCGNHTLMCEGDSEPQRLEAVMQRGLTWMMNDAIDRDRVWINTAPIDQYAIGTSPH